MEFTDETRNDNAFSPDGIRLILLLRTFLTSEQIATLDIGDFTRGAQNDDGTLTLINEERASFGTVSAEVDRAVSVWYTGRRFAKIGDDIGIVGRLFIHTDARTPVTATEIEQTVLSGQVV
jgi:hypothetical protein